MGDWHVGDPVGFGNEIGAPELPYLDYVNSGSSKEEEREPREKPNPNAHLAKIIADEALRLEKEHRYEEALVFINRSLELASKLFDSWNIKAIILDNMGRHEMALEYYDRFLEVKSDDVVKANKSLCLYRIARDKYGYEDYENALDYVNDALALLPDDIGRDDYLRLKGDILNSLGRHEQANKCHMLADGREDELRNLERIQRPIEDSNDIRICITGVRHYKGFEPFRKGLVVELFKEAGNDYDSHAIRVEITGETVGYVANSPNTVPEGVMSATQIQRIFTNRIEAKILSVDPPNHIIAKLMK